MILLDLLEVLAALIIILVIAGIIGIVIVFIGFVLEEVNEESDGFFHKVSAILNDIIDYDFY